MKIAILLKSAPDTAEAERTLTIASDMLSQGHAVTLCLLQEAVHLCQSGTDFLTAAHLQTLLEKQLAVQALKQDCSLRGIDPVSGSIPMSTGDYSSLIDLIESSDRVIGIL
jgi:sulfur transfer complex TusBCD TusB component (DsrH family)